MSGIVGIVNGDGQPADRALLEQMTASLAFRGPDAQQVWTDGPVGFGHALLQTADDLPGEKQPLSVDGKVWITADARIDGQAALIGKLRAAHQPPGDRPTDAELILRAYLAWGDACTEQLVGDFAFAIWDGRTGRLFCVRDHLGVKPFFYAELTSGLVFSNTLSCIRQHSGVSDELNEQALADFLLFGHNTEPDTTSFTGIRRLPPAHTLEWTPHGLQTRCYWTMPVREPLRYKNSADYVEQFEELLQAAVSDRLRTRRVAVMMSGGLDSSSIAAMAHELLSKGGRPFDLRASTVVFDTVIRDEERHFAGLVADHLQIPISYEVADTYKLLEQREHRSLRSAEPRSLAGSARQIDRMQNVAEHSRVLLTGQGGDIILRPSASYLAETLRHLKLGQFAGDVWRHARTYGRMPRLGLRTRFKRVAGIKHKRRTFPEWIDPEFSARLDLRARWAQFHGRKPENVHHHRPEAYQIVTAQWWRLFEGLDPGTSGFAVEYRHPLWDLRVVDFALTVPSMPWCVDKALVREIMRNRLPEVVRCRRKTPLAGDPLETFMKDSGAEWLYQIPESQMLRRYIQPEALQSTSEDVVDFRPAYLNYWLQSIKRA